MTTTKQPMTANAYVCNVYTMLAVVAAAAAYICQLCWPFNSSLHFIFYRVLLWQLDRGGSKGGYNSCTSAILQKVNIKFRHCLLATSGPALNLLIHILVGTFSIFGLCTCFISVFLHSFTLFFHFYPRSLSNSFQFLCFTHRSNSMFRCSMYSQYAEWLRVHFFIIYVPRGIATQSDIHLFSYLYACLGEIRFHLLEMLLAIMCALFNCSISWTAREDWECKNQIRFVNSFDLNF